MDLHGKISRYYFHSRIFFLTPAFRTQAPTWQHARGQEAKATAKMEKRGKR